MQRTHLVHDECPLLVELLEWAELERPTPLITLHIIVYIFPLTNLFGATFYMYRYAWAVINEKRKKKTLYIIVVWGGDKLNVICDDVVILLHCGLWSGQNRGSRVCPYKLPLPTSRSGTLQNGSRDSPKGSETQRIGASQMSLISGATLVHVSWFHWMFLSCGYLFSFLLVSHWPLCMYSPHVSIVFV